MTYFNPKTSHIFVSITTILFTLLFLLVSPSYTQADQTLSYTYNNLGLISSIDGQRTDVSDITRFEYDTQGNLTKIINALNHETLISAYDPNGRPQTIIDPNGAITELRYDLRGYLISFTTEENSIQLTYNPAGKIILISLAGGQT